MNLYSYKIKYFPLKKAYVVKKKWLCFDLGYLHINGHDTSAGWPLTIATLCDTKKDAVDLIADNKEQHHDHHVTTYTIK